MTVSPVHRIEHPTAPVEVWRDDTVPAAPVVGIDVGYPGRQGDDPVFVPVEVAREVAHAIMSSLRD